MLPLAGYAERLSARPGQTLRFHVANATGAAVLASVVRVRCADPNPAIGGVRTEPVDVAVTTLAEPRPQGVPLGSFAVLGPPGLLQGVHGCGRRCKSEPPRRPNIEPGVEAGLVLTGCG